jgi:NAD(P)H-flavin reductase/ferredoxin/2-polyprenyl-6-methoxyphenol hydroxylase-like FAD-dependent oxidoreductase
MADAFAGSDTAGHDVMPIGAERMPYQVIVRYADGAERRIPAEPGDTILDAAEACGAPIVSECRNGVCGTCVGLCASGDYIMDQAIGLSRDEQETRRVLCCQTRVRSDCVIDLDYPLADNAAQLVVGAAVVIAVERLSPQTALLMLDASGLAQPIRFKPGQFADLKVPGAEVWRSYSFAQAGQDVSALRFLIRLLPNGAMSDYLRDHAAPGDRIDIRASKGGFFLRDPSRPILLMAGGTGLSAILAIAEQLAREAVPQPVRLIYGVTDAQDLVLIDRLARLVTEHPDFSWRAIAQHASPAWRGATGLATDLLDETDLNGGDIDAYLCGPPAMVQATRDWLQVHGLNQATVYAERFVASGMRPSAGRRPLESAPENRVSPASGRGVAVVIGGSIAGMATAKVLTETFETVIVLEKDDDHRRGEARPGAAQGWHLHHLLIAGQRQLETIFPGVIDDMTAAGAFRVDMGEQYRIMLAGSWKRPGHSGVDIVCAGRPLLEWCVRRRIDAEPAIQYRYASEVSDLVFDAASRTVVGVKAVRGGVEETIAAEFVVDASGKNTPVPAMLDWIGLEAPAVEEDCLNCFYSTMRHRVPAGQAWRDKVMVICYAQRPQQQYYAAQYYTDTSRTVLLTSLVGYNCYSPPRNAEEFREFARLMPSSKIGEALDGLEPCSPVYNFRYPEMRRLRYEDMAAPPAGLVAIGDAYCSADPVSGVGITKALLELDQLRALLRRKTPRDQAFSRTYYQRIGKIADQVWSLIREQNLRYPWIKDGDKKRAFYFRLQNWYVDRIFELMLEDHAVYGIYLRVSHLVEPATALMKPSLVARVLARWLVARLTSRKTLIERNFAGGRMGDADAMIP